MTLHMAEEQIRRLEAQIEQERCRRLEVEAELSRVRRQNEGCYLQMEALKTAVRVAIGDEP